MNNNETIMILKGPDKVRRRPSVVFGDVGSVGVTNATKNLLDIFLVQAAKGLCSQIDLMVESNGEVTVKSYDNGFALSEKLIKDKPAWYHDFCELYTMVCSVPGSTLAIHNTPDLYGEPIPSYPQIDCLPFVDLTCVQYACQYMKATVLRDGVLKKLSFVKGFLDGTLEKEKGEEGSYTCLTFLLDAEVFGTSTPLTDELADYLRIAAATIPGLKCVFENKAENKTVTFKYEKGISDFACDLAGGNLSCFMQSITANGKERYNTKEYKATARVAICFVPSGGKSVVIHNYRKLEVGGRPFEKLKSEILKYLSWDLRFKGDFDLLADKITIVLSTNCDVTSTRFETSRKDAINNIMITDMASDLISHSFRQFIKIHKDDIKL